MTRLLADMGRDDVEQWLGGGVFLVRTRATDPGAPYVWAGWDENHIRCRPVGGEVLLSVPIRQCHTVWPVLGSVNVRSGYAVHIERLAVRHYRRTYNERGIRAIVPMARQVASALGCSAQVLGSWGQVFEAPWLSVYPADYGAVELLFTTGQRTVAVNRRLIVGGDAATDKRMFYVDGVLVATACGEELLAHCDDETRQVVVDALGGRYGTA
jgi:hypothetical protein